MSDRLFNRTESQLRQKFANFLRDIFEEGFNEFRLSREAFAQLWVLSSYANWARIEMANAHHDATRYDERSSCKTKLLGTKQRSDNHIASGLHLSINLNDDAIAQTIEHQGLLCLS